MKLSIIGTGYVGLVTGVCFAEMGNHVFCADVDTKKIEMLRRGELPIYEPGLEELVERNLANGNLYFTDKIEQAVAHACICIIAVGTPMGPDGSVNMQYVHQAAVEIGQYIAHDMIIVDKSTVPVGTARSLEKSLKEEMRKRGVDFSIKIVSNPEFLKEGSAIEDCMRPDRVVIGTPDEETTTVMKELYAPFIHNRDRFFIMDVASAEMTKYASNAMLATRISFMNELSCICEATGADINQVRLGMGSDNRIGYSFLYAGCGYGGSCFPKDVQALIHTAKKFGCTAGILENVEKVNQRQKTVLVKKIVDYYGEDLSGKKFAVWGLAFKPETDDMREAPSVPMIKSLLDRGAVVTAYDPQVKESLFSESFRFSRATDKYSALENVHALILVTEWKEFRSPDFEQIKQLMKMPVIFDGRNQYSAAMLQKLGFTYIQIGVGR
jgi:UDPglucose 6-dehydrogenase